MDSLHERHRTVRSAGADLAVFEYGREPASGTPTILFLHGYPDDHRVFLPVIEELIATHHLVTFDTRNAGHSVPARGGGFTLTELVDDVVAVLESIDAPDGVRLVGHDWGSIQGWAVIQDPRVEGRVLDWTSISGPDLRHFSRWLRGRLRTPTLLHQGIGQVLRSWYVGFFQLPALPELLWRSGLKRSYELSARRNVGADPVRGLALYRTNMLSRHSTVPPRRTVTLPVHVIVPTKDPFLSPHLVDGLEDWVEDLTVTHVPGGHWWISARPGAFADLLGPARRAGDA